MIQKKGPNFPLQNRPTIYVTEKEDLPRHLELDVVVSFNMQRESRFIRTYIELKATIRIYTRIPIELPRDLIYSVSHG